MEIQEINSASSMMQNLNMNKAGENQISSANE